MPAARTERRVVAAQCHAHRGLQAGGDREQQRLAAGAVAFGDGQCGRNDFGGGVIQRRPVHVAHRDGGDEIAVQHRRAGERQASAADHGRFFGRAQLRRERLDLVYGGNASLAVIANFPAGVAATLTVPRDATHG